MQFTKSRSTNSRRKWRTGLVETGKSRKKSPKNRKTVINFFQNEIKALTGKASVGFRISLLFHFSTSKLVSLAKFLSTYSLVPL